jgi:MoxR-like ATPase
MSTTSSPSSGSQAQVSDQQLLSHLVDALLRQDGDKVTKQQLALQANDFEDTIDVDGLLREGQNDGVYSLGKHYGQKCIKDVSPVRDRPKEIEDAFKEVFATNTDETGVGGEVVLTDLTGVGDALADNLRQNGYDDMEAIAGASADELGTVPQVTKGRAGEIIKQAEQHVDSKHALLRQALAPYKDDSTQASSTVRDLQVVDKEVGTPLKLVDPSADEVHVNGFPVLEDVNHPQVPDTSEMIEPEPVDDPIAEEPAMELMAKILARNNFGLMVIGPPGSGKNLRAAWLHGQTNRTFIQADMTEDRRDLDFLGVKTVTDKGVVVHEDRPFTRLAKNGGTLCINEWNMGRDSVQMLFQTVLADGTITVASAQEVIEVHPEFRLMVTQNPVKRENRGTKPVNRANLGRFRSVRVPYTGKQGEVNVLDSKHNTDRTMIDRETLHKLVAAAQETRDDNANGPMLSTRDLEAVVESVDDGLPPKKALRKRLQHHRASQPYNDPAADWPRIEQAFNRATMD